MKSKDWSVIMLIAFFAGVFSLVLSNFIIGSRKTNTLKVESVSPITQDFPTPNEKYFNTNSINPTQDIKIGEDPNANPFKKN